MVWEVEELVARVKKKNTKLNNFRMFLADRQMNVGLKTKKYRTKQSGNQAQKISGDSGYDITLT